MRPKLLIGKRYIVEFYDNDKFHKCCLIYLGIEKVSGSYVWSSLNGKVNVYLRKDNCYYLPLDGEVYEAN